MLNCNQIERMASAGCWSPLLRRVMENGRVGKQSSHRQCDSWLFDVLCESETSLSLAAVGLGLQRTIELQYGWSASSQALLSSLMRHPLVSQCWPVAAHRPINPPNDDELPIGQRSDANRDSVTIARSIAANAIWKSLEAMPRNQISHPRRQHSVNNASRQDPHQQAAKTQDLQRLLGGVVIQIHSAMCGRATFPETIIAILLWQLEDFLNDCTNSLPCPEHNSLVWHADLAEAAQPIKHAATQLYENMLCRNGATVSGSDKGAGGIRPQPQSHWREVLMNAMAA